MPLLPYLRKGYKMNWLDLSISMFNTRYGFSYSTWVLLPKEAQKMEDVVDILAKRGTFQDVVALFEIIERADCEATLSAKWVLSDWMERIFRKFSPIKSSASGLLMYRKAAMSLPV